MPELPDIELYVARLAERLLDRNLLGFGAHNSFVLRSFEPIHSECVGQPVTGVSRIGKRLVIGFPDDRWCVIHLMIAGRLQWVSPAPAPKRESGKIIIATWRFEHGDLALHEASKKKRASVTWVRGTNALRAMDRGGINVLESTREAFEERLISQNRTLKRALTDPTIFDGIGNAYSDEILFAAKLSPVRTTRQLSHDEAGRLYEAIRATLEFWRLKLAQEIRGFPKPAQVTAFRPDFAVHGRFGQPCPNCAMPVQRIVYAENETNYCARCQNEDRMLADRSLSRLLKDDWPRTIEEMAGG